MIERWAFRCDECEESFDSLDELASCEMCGADLCTDCVSETKHVVLREADEGKRTSVECPDEVMGVPA